MVERLAPEVIAEERRISKGYSADVDFFSGFVYSMLDLPLELYSPMFAVARIVGWSAHRMEELINADRIIRPAYKNVLEPAVYVPLNKRDHNDSVFGGQRTVRHLSLILFSEKYK